MRALTVCSGWMVTECTEESMHFTWIVIAFDGAAGTSLINFIWIMFALMF